MSDSIARFALCIDSAGAEALEQGEVYQILQYPSAEEEGLLRVIDESAAEQQHPAIEIP